MKIKHSLLVLVVGLCLGPALAPGGQPGEPAAPLEVKEWVQGGPLEIKPGTNVFVVNIFTTRSPASRACITNLNALQSRFKSRGVIVVGISDEPAERIRDFLGHDGSNILYAVAADDRRRTSLNYMMPARQMAVPWAFVVGTNGLLLWHGHPLRGLGDALDEILTGRFNVESWRKADLARAQMAQYVSLASRGDARAGVSGRRLLELRTNNVELLTEMAYQIVADPQLQRPDLALAGEALDRAERLNLTNSIQLMVARGIWLFQTGQKEKGLARARQALVAARLPADRVLAEDCLRAMDARLRPKATNVLDGGSAPASGK